MPALTTMPAAPVVGVGPLQGTLHWAMVASPYLAGAAVLGLIVGKALSRMRAAPDPRQSPERFWVLVMLLAGTMLAHSASGLPQWTTLLAVEVAAFVGVTVLAAKSRGVRRRVAGAVWRLDRMSDRQQFVLAIGIAVFTALYLPLTPLWQHRPMLPQIHDELSYAVMARIYASGRLWMPALPAPLDRAMETFYVYTTPVYGSMYFPGAGFLYGAALRVGLPLWAGSTAAAGVGVATLYRVIGRLFSPACGLATAVALLAVPQFRWLSVHVFSHVPLIAAVLLAYWAYLRWTERQSVRWAAALATVAGYAIITRPYDALALLAPVAVAVLVGLARRGGRVLATQVAVAALCLAPFAGLQLVIDHAFTGDALRTPFSAYFDRDMPNAGFGYYPTDPNVRPQSTLEQKQGFYDTFAASQMDSHTLPVVETWAFFKTRLDAFAQNALGSTFILIVLPLGLVAALRPRLWPVAVAPAALLLAYMPYPYFLRSYGLSTTAGVAVCLWAAVRPIAALLRVRADVARRAVAAGLVAVGVAGQAFWWPTTPDAQLFDSVELADTQRLLDAKVRKPALVFFVYPHANPYVAQVEPVYNWQTPWPDDAGVIRVHSRGPEADLAVLRYYAEQNGRRNLYVVDRKRGSIADEGTVDAFLSRQSATRPTATSPATAPTVPSPERSPSP